MISLVPNDREFPFNNNNGNLNHYLHTNITHHGLKQKSMKMCYEYDKKVNSFWYEWSELELVSML